MITTAVVDSPVGPLRLGAEDGRLTEIDFVDDSEVARNPPAGEVLQQTAAALTAYFAGDLHRFEIPLALSGTDFQQRVWHELTRIGYGQTVSYGDLAERLGLPTGSARAVGLANGANPIPIVVPCHRVIGADGSLTGYGGGLDRKRFLLDLERRQQTLFALDE